MVAPLKGATHWDSERTLYWILDEFFSSTVPASRSISHKCVDAENIGFLHHSIDLDILFDKEDLSNNPLVLLNMPCTSSTAFVLGIVTC